MGGGSLGRGRGTVGAFSAPMQAADLKTLMERADSQDGGISDIHLRRPTLEDVFLQLTGRRMRD